jgi:hypothetical protein
MFDGCRRQFARRADFPVGGIVLELEGEQLQRELGELRSVECGVPIGNQPAQARGEAREFFVHAVFVRGWFSATASRDDNTRPFRRKRDCLCAVCPPDCPFNNEQTVLHHHGN